MDCRSCEEACTAEWERALPRLDIGKRKYPWQMELPSFPAAIFWLGTINDCDVWYITTIRGGNGIRIQWGKNNDQFVVKRIDDWNSHLSQLKLFQMRPTDIVAETAIRKFNIMHKEKTL